MRPLPHGAKKPKLGPMYNLVPTASPDGGLKPNGHSEKECLPKYNLIAKTSHCQFEPTVPYHNRDASRDWRRWLGLDANTSRPPHPPRCRRAQVDRENN